MSGKLIIQGKAWGEFESAKRSKGNIEISGYRSYGGTHTVRMVDQPQLNENQKLLLEDLREIKESQKDKNMLGLIWVLGQRFTTKSNIKSFTDQEILVVLQALEQEEE